MESARKEAEKLGAFIAAGTSPYHAVREAERILTGNGFIELKEDGRFAIETGKSYFIQRGEKGRRESRGAGIPGAEDADGGFGGRPDPQTE